MQVAAGLSEGTFGRRSREQNVPILGSYIALWARSTGGDKFGLIERLMSNRRALSSDGRVETTIFAHLYNGELFRKWCFPPARVVAAAVGCRSVALPFPCTGESRSMKILQDRPGKIGQYPR